MPFSLAFYRMIELRTARGLGPLFGAPGIWHEKVDDCWRFALNGQHEEQGLPGSDVDLPPMHAIVWRNEMPVGEVTPVTGRMMHGTEDAFIAALDGAIASAKAA